MSVPDPVDFTQTDQVKMAVRIGRAWIDMRRAAAMIQLRDYLFGTADDAIEQGQMDTLDLLSFRPSWRMSELAEKLRVDPSTGTRAVQRLVNAGLAERRQSDDDGRVVIVAMTPEGRALHEEVNGRRSAFMAHLLGSYTAEERPVLADLLERFVHSMDEFLVDLSNEERDDRTRNR